MDLVLNDGWSAEEAGASRRFDGGRRMLAAERTEFNSFVWKHDKDEIRLTLEGDSMSVSHLASTKLRGPSQICYVAQHRRATHAAWDVMARVIRASRDEDEGVRVGRSAARWMRDKGMRD